MTLPPTAAVLGHPIDHSQSPPLHAAAYRGLGMNIDYHRYDLTAEQLPEFIDSLPRTGPQGRDWLGFSVTMPLKAEMVPQMDSLSQRVQRLGFLNTVVFDAEGVSTGYNTDVDGIVGALRFAGYDPDTSGGTMGILGGGGTAAAAILAAQLMGIDRVELLVRTPAKAAEHADLAGTYGLEANIVSLDDFPQRAPGYRSVVSTLPPRAADDYAAQLHDVTELPPLLDAAYDPWPSELALAWQRHNGQVVSGSEMLLYQAVEQAQLFTRRLPQLPTGIDWATVTDQMALAVGLSSRH